MVILMASATTLLPHAEFLLCTDIVDAANADSPLRLQSICTPAE
jgi:hypothetical protein